MDGIESLFGSEFDIQLPKKKADVKKLVKKASTVVQTEAESTAKLLKSKKLSIQDRLNIINTKVLSTLGKQRYNTVVIRSLEDFSAYIDKAIEKKLIAVDTETNNSLDPITCKLMGLCLYVPGEKQAYIPINHVNPETGERLSWQLTEQDCHNQLQRIVNAKTYVVMHNGKFDYKVIKCTCDIEVVPDWDTLLAAKLLDENEFSAGLKQLYIKYIDPTQEKYSIEHLFTNVEYAQVDPEIFALYAATDSMMTEKLYEWQLPRMLATKEEPGPKGKSIYDLFMEVEMPCLYATAQMELNGILFNKDFAQRLKVKFESELNEIDTQINDELKKYEPTIVAWKAMPENGEKSKVYVPATTKMSQEKILVQYPEQDAKGRFKWGKAKASQLEDPINLASPSQLAILFYDILGLQNKEKDRSTGEDALVELGKTNKIAKLLLERRGVVKLLDAFINSLPEKVNPKTGKIHGSFNQYGAATGRFSSSEPNLQQIPSHMKNIRMLFMADHGYKLIGSDFSQQEVRVLAELSKDPALIKSYKENKDIYATVASGVYHMGYWDCMEHHEDGSPNPEGKKRRASCKSIVLGIMYSRGANAIAEQIGSTKQEAQDIVNNFYDSFPTVKSWMDDSLANLRKRGYVEDFYGRRRRLPDINLKPYTAKLSDPTLGTKFNPFLNCQDKQTEHPAIVQWKNFLGAAVINSNIRQMLKPDGQINDEMSNQKFDSLKQLAANPNKLKETTKDFRYAKTNEQKLVNSVNSIFEGIQRGYLTTFDNTKKEDVPIEITPEIRKYLDNIIATYSMHPMKITDMTYEKVDLEAFTGRRAQAERQCVNARIQGSSATMTKIAMNKIVRDEELKKYGFKLLIGVHDELIGEVKEEFAEVGARRLCEIMKTCVADLMEVSFKCDPSIVSAWYEDEMAYQLQDTLKEYEAEGKTEQEARDIILKDNSEFLPSEIDHLLAYKG